MKIRSALAVLDKKGLVRLRKYLQSEYFCTDSNLSKLLEWLIDNPREDNELAKAKLWKAIFGNIPYEDVKLRLLFSRLLNHIENFIKIESAEKEEINLSTVRIYRRFKEDKLFLQALEEQKTRLDKSPLRNEHYYDRMYDLSLEEYDYLVTKKRQGEFNLKHIFDSIEIAYSIKKLRHCCRVLQIQSLYKLEFPFPSIENVLTQIEQNQWNELPVLGFYYYNYQSILNPQNSDFFDRCVEHYNRYEDHFEEEERRYAFIDILNYCIRKLNEGSDSYYKIIFDLYDRGLTQGFLLDQGKLSRFTYRNIAEIGILMKEYSWVLQFLEEYKNKLDQPYRQSFYLLEKARVMSDQRNYTQAIELLANLNFSDPLIELSTRLERIKIFYELDEMEVCQYHVESMDLFLRRKKNVGYHSPYYKNFLTYTRKLLKPEKTDHKFWKTNRAQLENEEKITGRIWLAEKYDERVHHLPSNH